MGLSLFSFSFLASRGAGHVFFLLLKKKGRESFSAVPLSSDPIFSSWRERKREAERERASSIKQQRALRTDYINRLGTKERKKNANFPLPIFHFPVFFFFRLSITPFASLLSRFDFFPPLSSSF